MILQHHIGKTISCQYLSGKLTDIWWQNQRKTDIMRIMDKNRENENAIIKERLQKARAEAFVLKDGTNADYILGLTEDNRPLPQQKPLPGGATEIVNYRERTIGIDKIPRFGLQFTSNVPYLIVI